MMIASKPTTVNLGHSIHAASVHRSTPDIVGCGDEVAEARVLWRNIVRTACAAMRGTDGWGALM